MINKEIIIWDNDGTIMGSKNPHDTTDKAKVILPNVQQVMTASNAVHVICSGCKTPESELQNFDPESIIKRFTALMEQLPIKVAVFSPAIGGTECYVIIKKTGSDSITIQKAHEDIRYQHLIGQFKKPGIGMLVVIRDVLDAEFGIIMSNDNAVMVGDTWHDEHAAVAVGIPFVDATYIHGKKV
jgi:histidinol phosphatase-like enzyme